MDINLPSSLTIPSPLMPDQGSHADSPPTGDVPQSEPDAAPVVSPARQSAEESHPVNMPGVPHIRLAQSVALPTDVPDPHIDASSATNPATHTPPDPFNAVAVITPAEAASLSLTAPQRTAIMKLTSGSTRVDAASAAGVTRLTLYRWLNHDPAFQCAYNAWQKDLITTAQGQLLAATRDAMSTVLTAIRKGDARLAWKLLESQGITSVTKAGPTDIHELERKEALEKKKREIAERKERHNVKLDDMLTLDGM